MADLVRRSRGICARDHEPHISRRRGRRSGGPVPSGCVDAGAVRRGAARRLRRHADPRRYSAGSLRVASDHDDRHVAHGRGPADHGALPQHRRRDLRTRAARRRRRRDLPRCAASGGDLVSCATRADHGPVHRHHRPDRPADRPGSRRCTPARHQLEHHLRQHRRPRRALHHPRRPGHPQPSRRARCRRDRGHRYRRHPRRHLRDRYRRRHTRSVGAPGNPSRVLVSLHHAVRRHRVRPPLGYAVPHRCGGTRYRARRRHHLGICHCRHASRADHRRSLPPSAESPIPRSRATRRRSADGRLDSRHRPARHRTELAPLRTGHRARDRRTRIDDRLRSRAHTTRPTGSARQPG